MPAPFLTPVPVLATTTWRMSADDRRLAMDMARLRQDDNEAKARPDAYGAAGGLALHAQGTMSELAFARMAGLSLASWAAFVDTSDLNTIPADVSGCQVRSTTYGSGRLVIHPADVERHALQPYVLIINRCPVFRAAGWVYAVEARRPEWWCQPNHGQAAAWFVPQRDLNPWPRPADA